MLFAVAQCHGHGRELTLQKDERWHDQRSSDRDSPWQCSTLLTTGCGWGLTTQGPSLGPVLAIPIPISPYFQERKEDEAWENERYDRVPILGPITSGGPPVALDPPSDDEVMRAMEKARPVEGGVPLLYERNRNNVRIVKYKIADYVDPPRVYPLVGPAQQHHAHYKCIDLLRRRPPHRLAGAAHDPRRRHAKK